MDRLPYPPPMMKCGHAANSLLAVKDGPNAGERIPACVICSGLKDRDAFKTIDDSPPSLEWRLARCAYYGQAAPATLRNKGHCPTRTREDMTCRCERPSSTGLWFFEQRTDKEHDQFYCSCWGDD